MSRDSPAAHGSTSIVAGVASAAPEARDCIRLTSSLHARRSCAYSDPAAIRKSVIVAVGAENSQCSRRSHHVERRADQGTHSAYPVVNTLSLKR